MSNKKIITFFLILVALFLVKNEAHAGTGILSLNMPNVVGVGSRVSVPLNLNVTSGQFNGWMIDIVMDPNYITVQSGADILGGNIPNALLASNNACVYGSPPCNPPEGMQVTRVTGVTTSTGITGNVNLNNITFTGVATSSCGTTINVIVQDMIDDSAGYNTKFSPMPANLSFKIQESGGFCDTVSPSAPAGLSVL